MSILREISDELKIGIYNVLNNFIYKQRVQITLTGSSGAATVVVSGVSRVATYQTSRTKTAENFVTAFAADYLSANVILTSLGEILIFTGATIAKRFTGASSITNLSLTLGGTVAANNITYPVYITIPKPSAQVYVHIHNVLYREEGTKEDFGYIGTVQVETVDESQMNADKTLASEINGIIKGLLKPTRTSTPTLSASTVIVFKLESHDELSEPSDTGLSRSRLIDIYNFIIE